MAILGMEDADFLLSRDLIRQDQYDRNAATIVPAPTPVVPVAAPAPMPIGLTDPANVAAPAPIPIGLTDPANVAPAPAAAPVAPMSGFDLSQASIVQSAVAAQRQAEADQSAISQIARQQAEVQKDRQQIEADALKRANDVQKKHTAVLDDLAKTKISPDNYWAEKSTGQKIGIGIAMILGAFGSGSENKAVTIINQAIERDLDTQKSNYAAKKGAASELDSAYAKFYSVYKEEKAATAAAKAALIDQASLKIQGNAARYKGEAAVAAAKGALGQLQALKETELAKVAQAKAWGEDPQYAGMDEKTRERYIPKSDIPFMPFGKASLGTLEEVSKFRAESNDVADAIDSLKKLEDMGNLSSVEKFSPAQEALSEELRQTTIGKLRTAILGPGIINEQERAIMERIVADPLKFLSFNSRNMASLQALRNSLTSSVNRKGFSLGLKRGDPAGFEKEK